VFMAMLGVFVMCVLASVGVEIWRLV